MADQPKNNISGIHLNLTSVVEHTRQQLGNVLEIMGRLENVVLPPTEDWDHGDVDEEVATSAQATYIRCCNVLDTILDDPERWSLKRRNQLEKRTDKVLKAQGQMYKAAAEATNEQKQTFIHLRRPSNIFRPTIFQHNGRWLAVYGDLMDLENCIQGDGATADEALKNFDINFYTKQAEQKEPVSDALEKEKPATQKRKKK